MLGAYCQHFSMDLDQVYSEVDVDLNGMLDKAECKVFLAKLKENTSTERGGFYDEANFEKLFDKYDEDKNGFIEKAELAVFIKKVFKTPKAQKAKDDVKGKTIN
mmetsp:Transcript_17065/g.26350  ORF Transcript_17065/g.26350 Transcript_17065/m.26350 type:complete len:104 (+) Transcript_17065:2672-2983(+)